MSWRGVFIKAFWLWAISAHLFGFSQEQAPTTVQAALHQMFNSAAVSFIGTVEDVRRVEADGPGAGVVEIRFSIDQPLRGCSGDTYVLREWGGFWAANDSRYRVGQSLLLLLHAPGAAGLSSPVGGMEGAIPLRASGAGVHSSDQSSGSRAAQVADLRWIGAKLARTSRYKESKLPINIASRIISGATSAESEPSPTNSSDSSVPAEEISVVNLVGIIHSWEVASHATR